MTAWRVRQALDRSAVDPTPHQVAGRTCCDRRLAGEDWSLRQPFAGSGRMAVPSLKHDVEFVHCGLHDLPVALVEGD